MTSELAVTHQTGVDIATQQTGEYFLADLTDEQALTQSEQIFFTMVKEILPQIQANAPTNHLQIRWQDIDTTISPGDSTALELELLRYAHFCRGLGANHFKWGVEGTKFVLFAQGSQCDLPEVVIEPLIGLNHLYHAEAVHKQLADQLEAMQTKASAPIVIESFCQNNSDIEAIYLLTDTDEPAVVSLLDFQSELLTGCEGATQLVVHYDREAQKILVLRDGKLYTYTAKTKENLIYDEEQGKIESILRDPSPHLESVVSRGIEAQSELLAQSAILNKKNTVLPQLLQAQINLMNAVGTPLEEEAKKMYEAMNIVYEKMPLSYEEKVRVTLKAAQSVQEEIHEILEPESVDVHAVIDTLPLPPDLDFSPEQEIAYAQSVRAKVTAIDAHIRAHAEKTVRTLFMDQAEKILKAPPNDAELSRLLGLISERFHIFQREKASVLAAFTKAEAVPLTSVLRTFYPEIQALFIDDGEKIVNVSEHIRRQNLAQKYGSLSRRDKMISKVEETIQQEFEKVMHIIQVSQYYFPSDVQSLMNSDSILAIVRDPKSEDAQTLIKALENLITAAPLNLRERQLSFVREFLHRLGKKPEDKKATVTKKPEFNSMLRRVERLDHTIDLELVKDLVPDILSLEEPTPGSETAARLSADEIAQDFLNGVLSQEQRAQIPVIEEKKRKHIVEYTRKRLAVFEPIVTSLVSRFSDLLRQEKAPNDFVKSIEKELSHGIVFAIVTGEIMMDRYVNENGSVKQAYFLAQQEWATVFEDGVPNLEWKP